MWNRAISPKLFRNHQGDGSRPFGFDLIKALLREPQFFRTSSFFPHNAGGQWSKNFFLGRNYPLSGKGPGRGPGTGLESSRKKVVKKVPPCSHTTPGLSVVADIPERRNSSEPCEFLVRRTGKFPSLDWQPPLIFGLDKSRRKGHRWEWSVIKRGRTGLWQLMYEIELCQTWNFFKPIRRKWD